MSQLNALPVAPLSAIRAKDISIVIPVKDNPSGIERFLSHFFSTVVQDDFPLEILIVDNNSSPPLSLSQRFPIPVNLLRCNQKKGPAAARNVGVKNAKGNWVLFTDSDCIPTKSTIAGYLRENNQALAYAGNIRIVSEDPCSDYYRSRRTLIPPSDPNNTSDTPVYLVTANCLIQRNAITAVDGFNEAFKQAGGEDVDLAWRIKQIGNIEYCWSSITQHEFEDGFNGLIKRFIRYGRGNRQLAQFHKRPMFPQFPNFPKTKKTHHLLALIEYFAMIYGFYRGGLK